MIIYVWLIVVTFMSLFLIALTLALLDDSIIICICEFVVLITVDGCTSYGILLVCDVYPHISLD